MTTTYTLALFVLSLGISLVSSQTFQYSHGWTNGKRSESTLEEAISSSSKNPDHLDGIFVNCELPQLRLLVQENVRSQPLHLPCVLFGSSKRGFPENMVHDQRRRETPTDSNNY